MVQRVFTYHGQNKIDITTIILSIIGVFTAKMKKVFISQPMNGLSDLQIEKDRARVIESLYNMGYKPDEIAIIDTYIEENAPDNVSSGLWYLGKSLELLADADIAVFAKGWKDARGCQIEFKCAKEYGISYICED